MPPPDKATGSGGIDVDLGRLHADPDGIATVEPELLDGGGRHLRHHRRLAVKTHPDTIRAGIDLNGASLPDVARRALRPPPIQRHRSWMDAGEDVAIVGAGNREGPSIGERHDVVHGPTAKKIDPD